MKPLSLFTVVIAVLAITACGRASSDPGASPPSSSSAATGAPIIENEDKTAGLKGIDNVNNGIRDDVDRLIAQKYAKTPEIKKAAEQKARALQKDMEATTRAQARVAGDEIMRAAECAYQTLPRRTPEDGEYREKMSSEIEALTVNTKERYIAYWNSQKLSGGMVFETPDGSVCD